jgi:hypothetical protein
MKHLDLAAIAETPLADDPFPHLLVECAVRPTSMTSLCRDYPALQKAGSFMLQDVTPGPSMGELIVDLESEEFRDLVSRKLDVDLTGKPSVFTFRGYCSDRDGYVHTDSKSKIITILLYLNPEWFEEGGRLRLLRNEHDLEDFAVEIPPTFGRMLIFRRSDRSWHGHAPFEGPRRVLQMNYVRSSKTSLLTELRHRLSALTK